jgi:hypothetical protein
VPHWTPALHGHVSEHAEPKRIEAHRAALVAKAKAAVAAAPS